jgi:hypothetical protein
MLLRFIIRANGGTKNAIVESEGKKVADLRRGQYTQFSLESELGRNWVLDPRVHGEIRPFSMVVVLPGQPDAPVLTIRNHVFFHRSKAYLLTGIPEDVRPGEHLLGKRHVSRLDSFPFTKLEDIDLETWGRLRRNRGASVGTIDGVGQESFRVELSPELEDIGLPLAAAAYLLYTTA